MYFSFQCEALANNISQINIFTLHTLQLAWHFLLYRHNPLVSFANIDLLSVAINDLSIYVISLLSYGIVRAVFRLNTTIKHFRKFLRISKLSCVNPRNWKRFRVFADTCYSSDKYSQNFVLGGILNKIWVGKNLNKFVIIDSFVPLRVRHFDHKINVWLGMIDI